MRAGAPAPGTASVGDEPAKLMQLRDAGAHSEHELAQKVRLLGGG